MGLPLLLKNLTPKRRFDASAGLAGVLGAVDLNGLRDQVYQHLETAPVSMSLGADGTFRETVEVSNIDERVRLIRDIISESMSDPAIKKRAVSLKRGTDLKEVQAVFRFVQQNVRYESEEPEELFKDATTSLKHGYGDCDDMVILASALLKLQGFTVILRLIGVSDDQDFSHIYMKVGLPKKGPTKWLPFDASVERPLGWDISQEQKVTMQKEYKL